MNNSVGTIIITITRTNEGSTIQKIFKNVAPMERLSIGELMKVEALEDLKVVSTSQSSDISKEMD